LLKIFAAIFKNREAVAKRDASNGQILSGLVSDIRNTHKRYVFSQIISCCRIVRILLQRSNCVTILIINWFCTV